MTLTATVLSPEEFHLLNEYLELSFGLRFPDHKMRILESRLRYRLQALHLSDFMEYYLFLSSRSTDEDKFLISAVTNNYTYFFRETVQIDALWSAIARQELEHCIVPESLRILSAGCSSGEEPYTIRILGEEQGIGKKMNTHIDAIDIDEAHLTRGVAGVYQTKSLAAASDLQSGRYFVDAGDGNVHLRERYKEGVRFNFGNLVDLQSFQRPLQYDVVFCRNVLIYFSPASLRRAITNLGQVLRPGGLLFLGHSESIIGMFDFLESIRLDGCIAYRKKL